jgi:hypothetical protein
MALYLTSAALLDGELRSQQQFFDWHSVSKLATCELLSDTAQFLAAHLVVAED